MRCARMRCARMRCALRRRSGTVPSEWNGLHLFSAVRYVAVEKLEMAYRLSDYVDFAYVMPKARTGHKTCGNSRALRSHPVGSAAAMV